MATTKDASKGIECLKFSGKEEDYQVCVTKFDAYSMVKGFYRISIQRRTVSYNDRELQIVQHVTF